MKDLGWGQQISQDLWTCDGHHKGRPHTSLPFLKKKKKKKLFLRIPKCLRETLSLTAWGPGLWGPEVTTQHQGSQTIAWKQVSCSTALGQEGSEASRKGVELPESSGSVFILMLQFWDSRIQRKRKRILHNPFFRGVLLFSSEGEGNRSRDVVYLAQSHKGSLKVAKQEPEPSSDPSVLTDDTVWPPAFSSFPSSPATGDAELPDSDHLARDPLGCGSSLFVVISETWSFPQALENSAHSSERRWHIPLLWIPGEGIGGN